MRERGFFDGKTLCTMVVKNMKKLALVEIIWRLGWVSYPGTPIVRGVYISTLDIFGCSLIINYISPDFNDDTRTHTEVERERRAHTHKDIQRESKTQTHLYIRAPFSVRSLPTLGIKVGENYFFLRVGRFAFPTLCVQLGEKNAYFWE